MPLDRPSEGAFRYRELYDRRVSILSSSPVSIHLTVNSLALKRGGLVSAVMRRANALSASGQVGQVWIEVLSAQSWLEADVALLKAAGNLHETVRVRSVLRSLDISTKAISRHGGPRPALPEGNRLVVDPATTEILRDGVLSAVERRDSDGRLRHVDHYSAAAVRTQREEYDPHGRLARLLDYTATGKVGAERLIGQDGRPFLTIHHAGGSPKWTRAYLREQRVYPTGSIGEVYVEAFAHALADFAQPILFSEFRENLNNLPDLNLDAIVARIPHPNLHRVAVAHSNHHGSPYQRGAPIVPNWRKLLESAEQWDELVVWTEQQKDDLIKEYRPKVPVRAIPQYAPPLAPSDHRVDVTKVLLVSRLHRKKRVDEAVRIMRSVIDKVSATRLVVFGFGYDDDEERQILQLIEDLDLKEHIDFAGFTSDPSEIYDDAVVTLITSQSEGFSQVLLESLARGVPVVAYECCYGPREVVRDDTNGYIHTFGDVEAAAHSIVRVLTDPELRARLSAGALQTAAEFSPARFTANWLSLCQDVAANPARHVVQPVSGQSVMRTPRKASRSGTVVALSRLARRFRGSSRHRLSSHD